MNCQQFDTLVSDLAGDRLMDAHIRRQLYSHTADCPDCATHLDDERILTRSLVALAGETENAQAAPQLKATLMEAFVAQQSVAAGPRLVPKPVAPGRRPQIAPTWLLAAAAIILALLTGASLYLRSGRDQDPKLVRTDSIPGPVVALNERKADESKSATPKAEEPGKEKPAPANRKRSRPTSLRNLGAPTLASNNSVGAVGAEQTTDYIPLTYLADPSASQGGVVVRVEIPRATLLAMGLPVNTERGNSLVKADVVVSDDGRARAIRLVH